MPTGYTAGIIDGEIKDFKQFAKLCVRNFGATIHMRDEPFGKEWTPREPSDYHKIALAKAELNYISAQTLPLKQIVSERKTQLKKDAKYHAARIKEIEVTAKLLNSYLKEANAFVPPTPEHENAKTFMIQQLTETIKYDANPDYHVKELVRIEEELNNIKPEKIKASRIESAARDIKYHTENYLKEVEGCAKANKWVEQFFSAL